VLKRLAVLLAVIATCIAATAVPSSAQQPADVTGEFECTEPGTFTVTWTVENFAGADGEVTEAVLSGAAEGDITDAFDPNPFAFDDELIVGSSEVSGDTVGTVTLDITIVFDFKGPFTFEDSAEVELDGSCEAPPTSESTTTSTTVAAQADVRPTFTG
jgi:hypothetical protein